MKTTTIVVLGERWDVPRGFGAAYRREVARQMDSFRRGRSAEITSVVSDMLLMIGYEASVESIADWPLRKRVEAVVYAATVHARAGDNPVQRHPELEWLPKPWQGKPADRPEHIRPDLWGAFAGPGPTRVA